MTRFERKEWTDHELMRAKKMRANGESYSAIDRTLGRYVGSTQQKLTYNNDVQRSAGTDHASPGIRAPAKVLAERDARRAASDRRTRTAEICGDPPPGYSMLDRRQS